MDKFPNSYLYFCNRACSGFTDVKYFDIAKHFSIIELRVGTIEACEPIPKSDKLYRLQVNFGSEGTRQILSGIKQFFAQEQLVGKQAIFVFNLKPRIMMGFESHGMLLIATDDKGVLQLVGLGHPVPNGTRLK